MKNEKLEKVEKIISRSVLLDVGSISAVLSNPVVPPEEHGLISRKAAVIDPIRDVGPLA